MRKAYQPSLKFLFFKFGGASAFQFKMFLAITERNFSKLVGNMTYSAFITTTQQFNEVYHKLVYGGASLHLRIACAAPFAIDETWSLSQN